MTHFPSTVRRWIAPLAFGLAALAATPLAQAEAPQART